MKNSVERVNQRAAYGLKIPIFLDLQEVVNSLQKS